MAFLDRPLTLGLLAGWLTGRWDAALPLAVFLELFWLDLIRLGAVVPPVASLSFLLLFPMQILLDLPGPQTLPLPLLLCLACANLGAWLERYERLRANVLAEEVDQWIAGYGGGLSPEKAVVFSLTLQSVLRFVLYIACWGGVYSTMAWAQRHACIPVLPDMSWNILYGLGLLGAVLALRIRRAYVVLVCTMLLLVLLRV